MWATLCAYIFCGDYFFFVRRHTANECHVVVWLINTIQFRWNVFRVSENIIKNEQNHTHAESDTEASTPIITKKRKKKKVTFETCVQGLPELTCAPIASCINFSHKYLRMMFFLLVFHRVYRFRTLYGDIRVICTQNCYRLFFSSLSCMTLWWKLQLQMTETDVNQRNVTSALCTLKHFFFFISQIFRSRFTDFAESEWMENI